MIPTILRPSKSFILLALCLLAGCGGTSDSGRVLILGLDGLDPRAVDLLMSEGKMPHFARLRQEGAYGTLRSAKPILSPIVWTTIATGQTPDRHGIGHFTATDRETGEKRPVTSRMRRVKALWNIASETEREVAVVGWWATWPPETVRGSIVSDHAAYHFLFEEGFGDAPPSEADTYPPELAARIAPMLKRPSDLPFEQLAPFVGMGAAEVAERRRQPFDFNDELRHLEWAVATAQSYSDVGLDLWRTDRPDLAMVYIEGTDSVSHLFGHLFRVEELSGPLARQQALYGDTVEEMYLLADQLVGRYLEAMDANSTLLVLSDHGFDLGTPHDDPSLTADMRRVSERFHNIEGILYMHGRGIQPRAKLDRASILDITPTVLSLLGLPAARDMPGRVLGEGMREGMSEGNGDQRAAPTDRIASYESQAGAVGQSDSASGSGSSEATVDQAVLDRLRSLGYMGSASAGAPDQGPEDRGGEEQSTTGDRNLAGILFESGQYREAARLYKSLLDQEPDNAALRTSFAGTLGALGRFDEAIEQLEKAIESDPLNVEAYHNRAVIAERQGDMEAAVEDYRRVLRYAPDYQPSRQALLRLTGSDAGEQPDSPAEQTAYALASEASDAARRGDYDGAWELLEEAAETAPSFPLVYQYRANVAYLRGDRAGAIEALQRAIELDPDNALYRENLKRLQASPP